MKTLITITIAASISWTTLVSADKGDLVETFDAYGFYAWHKSNESIAGIGRDIHGMLMWIFIVAVILHIAGALKHHFLDKDRTLLRMFGK